MKWFEKIYALYRGEQNICDGTLPEIAARTNSNIETLRWMAMPSAIKRRDTSVSAPTILVPIYDLDIVLSTLNLSSKTLNALEGNHIFTARDLSRLSGSDIKKMHVSQRREKEIRRYWDYFKEVEYFESNHDQATMGDFNRTG